MSSSDSAADAQGSGTRFRDRVRLWREEAIRQAAAELLVEEGCLVLTMEQVAKRVGIAKGSLYLHATTRTALVSDLLDRWAEEVPLPDAGEGEADVRRVCAALFEAVPRGRDTTRPAIPCCLRTSPCPHGWPERWNKIATAYGFGASPVAQVLGEAVQSLASTPSVRGMIDEGRTGEVAELLSRLLGALNSPTVA